ncbi:hypothetical protein [Streptomyces sp. MZ04]|uniref:hypothetical protein n=1 Tax=Streptomyces sp. MZ04 TaxID=2559236 RepID=UPI00107EC45A|nr:hypothetical protein [Streptomyces sp. MZ04]TGA88441.1 hypothetical protein E2651_40015 [Streptomyces sp. MZ04]
MTDDQLHTDPLGLALSVISAAERRRFGEITDALIEAADAAAGSSSWTVRPAADSWRMLAEHHRAQRDPLWPVFSAAAARADAMGTID